MTEDDTDIRTLLATLTEELPPTRLTADHLVTAGRRRARWLPPVRRRGHDVPSTGSRRPGRLVTGLGIGSATAVGAAVAAVLALSSLVGDGVGGAPPPGDVQLGRDGQTLTAEGQLTSSGCRPRPALVADEVAGEVRLSLAQAPPEVPEPMICALGPLPVRVRLKRPLGDRPVRFGAHGPVLPVFDLRRTATSTYQPPGFTDVLESCEPLVQLGPGPSVHSGQPVTRCDTMFSKQRPPAEMAMVVLKVEQYFGPAPAPTGTVPVQPPPAPPRTVQVHGHDAQFGTYARDTGGGGRPEQWEQLTWTEHGERIVLTAGGPDRPELLPSLVELRKVADGLRW
jgi:hypothetical protein